MSELLEALEAAKGARKVTCPIAIILDGLDEDDRIGLETVLAGRTVNGRALTAVLVGQGYDIGDRAVNNHRNNVCSCRRKVDV